MADNILRLKVESSEYDAKLKKAAEGIRHLAEVAHTGGGELTGLEKAELDYIKSLGTMETKSRTAAGSVRELENTFKELTVVYNQLNDVEKQDEGGKALATSLDQLKQRAQAARAELDNASKSLNDNGQSAQQSGGILESLAGKFTLNIDALKLFDMGLSVTKAALDVAKDAFFASEANVDEWGRTVAASQSLYEGFLTALNTGDISGYLGRIDEIVSAARTAYNELDRLGTMKTIQTPRVSAQQTENERIRSMIQTGRYIAPIDGRRNAVFNGKEMQNGDKLTAGQIRALEKQLQNGMQNIVKLVGNEVKQTGKAIDAVYNRQAKELGMGVKEFRKGTSSMAEFDKRMAGYDKYQQWRTQHTTIDQSTGREIVARGNPYQEFAKWGTFRVDGDRYKNLVQLIQQRDQQAGQAYGMQSQAYRTMNRAEGVTVRQIMGGTSGKTTKPTKEDIQYADDSIMAQEKLVSDLTQKWKTASGELRDGYLKDLEEAQRKLAKMTEKAKGDGAPTFTMAQLEGISFDNQIPTTRGNEGKAQDKLDLATAAFATSGTSNVDFSNYISGIKNALSDADLGSELYNSMTEKLKDATTVSTILQEAMTSGVSAVDLSSVAQEMKRKLLEGDIDEDAWQQFLEQINEKIADADLKLTFDVDTKSVTTVAKQQQKDAQAMAKDWQAAGTAIQAVGNAMQQIEDPAAKVLGTIAQAVATMALSYAQAAASPAVTGTGWGWIAFAATGLATMISSITAIKQATAGFANGGVIPGNSMSGDNLRGMTPDGTIYGLNSQEIILNRAQQGNLASQLEGGGMQNLHLDTVIRGEDIRLVLNNNGRRTGRGEYVQSNRRS